MWFGSFFCDDLSRSSGRLFLGHPIYIKCILAQNVYKTFSCSVKTILRHEYGAGMCIRKSYGTKQQTAERLTAKCGRRAGHSRIASRSKVVNVFFLFQLPPGTTGGNSNTSANYLCARIASHYQKCPICGNYFIHRCSYFKK